MDEAPRLVLSCALIAGVASLGGCSEEPPAGADPPPVSTTPGEGGGAPWVDVFAGTGDSNAPGSVLNGKGGSTFPGATWPFGMVQLSPDTPNAAPAGYYDAPYVQSMSVNGSESTSSWLDWDALAKGATIEIVLGTQPNEAFGAAAPDRPPAFYP